MSVKIIICKRCDGTGKVEYKELEDYHHGTYNIIESKCDLCQGSGRLKETTTVTIEPYKP
jgi:DnaJ-class molecular chaperone